MTEPVTGLHAALKLALNDDIRLVKVLSKEHGSIVACELKVVSLRDNPKYTALSYTWGSPHSLNKDNEAEDTSSTPSHPLQCRVASDPSWEAQMDWYQILVTENLYAFLLQTQNDETHIEHYYWIDAISINQADAEEQTSQVKMMATIYKSADVVRAWLGQEDEDTHLAFQLIRALAACCAGYGRWERIRLLRDITPKALGTEELKARLGPCADVSYWKAMAKLFHRKYFTRAWMIQEITLASKMTAVCGRHSIDWDDVVKTSEFLTVTSWKIWISRVIGSHESNHSVPNLLDANKTSRNLLYTLIRGRRFKCKDPRDKVYALLGVAEDSVRGKNRFAPIYGKRSAAETYTLAAIQILEDSEDLLLLSCTEGDNLRTITSLPSWVPDWSYSRALGLGITGNVRFSAAGTIPRTLEIDEWNRRLTVKGFRLDDIVGVGESKRHILHGNASPNWLHIYNAMLPVYHTEQSRAEVFWRTLITDTAGAAPALCPASDSFRSAYISWMASTQSAWMTETMYHNLSSPFRHELAVLAAIGIAIPRSVSISAHDEQPIDPDDVIDIDQYETTLTHASDLRLFLTSRRYLGVGSESLLEHDSIWIIPGSRVPLILREVGTGTHRMVGPAYVHGFMRGEALQSDPFFRDITIL